VDFDMDFDIDLFDEHELENYAQVLVWGLKKARFHPFNEGDIVSLKYGVLGIPLAEKVYSLLLDMGVHVVNRPALTENMEKIFYGKASDRQLTELLPWERKMFKSFNGNIDISAPSSITHLQDIDPERLAKSAKAAKPLLNIMDRNEDLGALGWTLCNYPTQELANKASLTIEEYTEQIIKACYLDHDDPVSKWEDLYMGAIELKKWLNNFNVKYFHVESEHIDMKIFPGEKRKWVGLSGHNIPSFELYISPDCRYTEGCYYANQPSYQEGNYVQGVGFKFNKGRATYIKAEKGIEFTKKYLKSDTNAKKIGEFSLTDRRFSRIDKFMADTLYDENFGGDYGNCHIAVGDSYSDTYDGEPVELTNKLKKELGFNDSCIHWDLVNTEPKTVTAHLKDGNSTVIYENGLFNY
jgi:aminopeptidase